MISQESKVIQKRIWRIFFKKVLYAEKILKKQLSNQQVLILYRLLQVLKSKSVMEKVLANRNKKLMIGSRM